ncbi:zinc finger protein 436-like [Culicoides brevitarsis]|uniref:zinc finger protein 436-like n=1 Tax=Culicoides brevitarsis TaxID=469753 RepID=UPI00307B4B28
MDEDLYLKLCRLCLSKPEGELNFFIDTETKRAFKEALSDIQLEENSELSSIICESCMSLIQKIIEFKQSIRKNQDFLLNLLRKNEENSKLVQFAEVNLPVETDFSLKAEEINKESSNEDDSDYHEDTNPDLDDDSDTNSLSESEYARPDPESEPKSDKLPLPPLEFEKGTDAVWCPFCFQKFKKKYFLSKHGNLRHPQYNWAFRKPKSTRTRWTCKFCDKSFTRRFRLKQHAQILHFGRQPYTCDLCGHTSHLKSSIRGHIEGKHLRKNRGKGLKEPRDAVICRLCNHVSSNKEVYNQHMQRHEASEDRPFACKRCSLYFRTQKSFDKHNRHSHLVENLPFPCNLCISARFVTEEILNIHRKLHEVDETKRAKKPFGCAACELRFCKKSMLENHVRHHEKNELDSCQVCGMTLHRSSMADHMDKHKTKPEEFKNVCHLCGRRFRVEYSLMKHLKTHDAPQFYECDKCGKTIKKKCNFVNHVKKCDGPQTVFSCKFCAQTFLSKSVKYKHEDREHKGFSCKRCNMRFDRYQDLKVHRRTLEHRQKGKWGKLTAAGIAKSDKNPLISQ